MRYSGPLSVKHGLTDPDFDSELLLYHYTCASTLGLILRNGTVRLGPYTGVNDPRENKTWTAADLVAPAGGVGPASLRVQHEITKEVDRVLRRGARLACFTEDRHPTPDAAPDTYFHRGWGRAAMWDRYADKHKGLCLVFDRVELLQRVRDALPVRHGNITTWGSLRYVDAPLKVPLSGAFRSVEEVRAALDEMTAAHGVVRDLYMTKNRDWESEREFRVVVVAWNLSDRELDTPLFVAAGDCLRAVIVGDTGDVDAAATEVSSAGASADVLQCEWVAGAPVLRAPS